MRALALRVFAAVGITAVHVSFIACGDVLPVDDGLPGVVDPSRDGGIGSGADAAGDASGGDALEPDAEVFAPGERVVFVTRGTFNGNLGGVEGADQKCQAAAKASTLPNVTSRTFKAWISLQDDTVSSRLTHGDKPYRRVDGKAIANDWNDLTDGSLAEPLNRDEYGSEYTGKGGVLDIASYVWTGTASDGTYTTSCAGWKSNSGSTKDAVGWLTETATVWTSWSGAATCDGAFHLYCIEN